MGVGRADVAAGPVADESGTLPADIQHTADAPGRCSASSQAGVGRWRRAADVDSIWRSNDAAEISEANSHRRHRENNGNLQGLFFSLALSSGGGGLPPGPQ